MKNKITILHVVLSLEIGGMESVVANIARNIDKDLFRLVVICLKKIGPLGEELQDDGVKVILSEKMPRKISFLYPKALVRAIKKEGADIVHSHSGCWHKAAIAGKYSKVKGIIHTEHGRHVPDPKTTIMLDRAIEKLTDYIVPVSRDLSEYLKNIVRINGKNIYKIENGIDTDLFKPKMKNKTLLQELDIKENYFVIGNIARLALVKDHVTLIKAFDLAIRSCPNMRLLIVGDGLEKSNLQKLIDSLNLSEKVKLLGFRRDINKLLSIFDVFVLSSISEGTSMTILEAMASGNPVIASDVGGNSNLVTEDVTGFLVPPKNIESMAERISLFYANRKLGEKMGHKGREKIIRYFSVREMTNRYEELYLKLFKKK